MADHRREQALTHGPLEYRRPAWASLFAISCPILRAADVSGLGEQAREAILRAIIRAAAKVGNSPTGVRDLAEAYALLERDLVPRSSVVHNKT